MSKKIKTRKIIFDKRSAPFILEAFNVRVNSKGQAVDIDDNQILSPEGVPITIHNFGGVIKGKNGEPMFLVNDLLTAIKLHENLYK